MIDNRLIDRMFDDRQYMSHMTNVAGPKSWHQDSLVWLVENDMKERSGNVKLTYCDIPEKGIKYLNG